MFYFFFSSTRYLDVKQFTSVLFCVLLFDFWATAFFPCTGRVLEVLLSFANDFVGIISFNQTNFNAWLVEKQLFIKDENVTIMTAYAKKSHNCGYEQQ